MKKFLNTLNTAALTVLLFAGTSSGSTLANESVDTLLSQSPVELNDSMNQQTTALSGLQAMALGSSSMPTLPSPTQQRYKMVDTGGATTCAIKAGGKGIECFGFDQLGQAEPPKGDFKYISMGQFHGCALDKVGLLRCWGDANAFPKPEDSTKRYKQISAGTDHTCARTAQGELNCWGNNAFGEINIPPGLYIDVSAKSDHTCAIDKGYNLTCWGDKAFTSYGPFTGKYTNVSTGNLHACALRQSDKRAVCWGNNAYGQSSPPIDEFISLTSGSYHTCGQRADKTMSCWGSNQYGQSAEDLRRFAQIAAGGNQTCMLIQGTRQISCQGSFAFNSNLFRAANGSTQTDQLGQVKPQASLDSWLSGGFDWFGSSLSDGLETFFDPDMSKWVKTAKYGNIVFGLASFLITNLLEADDPNEARFKEIQQQLADIKVSLSDISSSIQTLNTMLASTNYMVAASWCDDRIKPLEEAENAIRIGRSYKGPIGSWRSILDDYQSYLNELESIKKTSNETKQPINPSLLEEKLSDLMKKVDQFKKDWLSEEARLAKNNIEDTRHKLTDMLIGKSGTSPLVACKAKSYQAWKWSPDLYPFDDRPIWAEATKVFIKTMSIQDQIADIETGVNSFEMMRIFQAPKKDKQGNAIPAYQWEPKEGQPGVCLLAKQSQYVGGASQRLKDAWGSDTNKGPCQHHQDLIKDIYVDQIRQFEAMGGAYSDDNVVLTMTSQQMGVEPNDGNRDQSNWLFFRRMDRVSAIEAYKDMDKVTRKHEFKTNTNVLVGISRFRKDTQSPFVGKLPSNIDGNKDYLQYLSTNTIQENTVGEYLWHSSGKAWKEVYQARQDVKNKRVDEKDRYEDFMQSMVSLKDPIKSCLNGKCSKKEILNKDTNETILVRQPDKDGIPMFSDISKKPFWIIDDDGGVPSKFFDMRLRSFEDTHDNNGFDSFYRRDTLPCFMAEGINNGLSTDGKSRDGHSWYHKRIWHRDDLEYGINQGKSGYDEGTREYLKLSGKVCGEEEFATILRTNSDLGWKWGVDCRDKEECWGLGAFFPVNPKFDVYKEYFTNSSYKLIYQNQLDTMADTSRRQFYFDEMINNMKLLHMPVTKITGRPCNPKLIADNIDVLLKGVQEEPVYSLRSPEREVGDGKIKVPSMCGNDLDRLIERYVPRSPYVDFPGVRKISKN